MLADHMDEIVENQDSFIHLIATGGPRPTSRDQVILKGQAWCAAFTEGGKKFARENGCPETTVFHFFEGNYPLQHRSDPIANWRERAGNLRRENNPNQALKKYRSFIDQTATLRESIEEGAAQVDAYIDGQIDRMRMKGRPSRGTGHYDT